MLPVDTGVPCGLILNELGGNALKHAFQGRNEGEVTVALQNTVDGRTRLSVSDNGVGIKPNEIPLIFDHFYRANTARGDDGGTGVGLTIAKRIVEIHGGKILVESQPGQGSVFSIILPIVSRFA